VAQRGAARALSLPARLVRALLKCCDPATPDGEMHLRCGECLGLLGALDPAAVSLQLPPPPPVLDCPRALKAEIFKHILRILRTAPSLELVDFCTYSLHGLRMHAFEGAPRVCVFGRIVCSPSQACARRRGLRAARAGDDDAAGEDLLDRLDAVDRSLAVQYDASVTMKLRQVRAKAEG